MNLITLAEFKAHARIAHDDEDAAIQAKVNAANHYVSQFLDTPDPVEPYTPPADLKQCAMLIAGHWWENRENAVSDTLSEIPLDADEILLNHRGWAF